MKSKRKKEGEKEGRKSRKTKKKTREERRGQRKRRGREIVIINYTQGLKIHRGIVSLKVDSLP